MNRAKLIAAAKRNAAQDARIVKSERFRGVIAAFTHAGLLQNNQGIPARKATVALEDVLWAGEVEPRLLELLPAVLLKKPNLVSVGELPEDLARVIQQLRHSEEPDAFRGMPGHKLVEWIPRVGHKNKLPSLLKSFRFQVEDVALLKELTEREGLNETQVIREALRALRRSRKPLTRSEGS